MINAQIFFAMLFFYIFDPDDPKKLLKNYEKFCKKMITVLMYVNVIIIPTKN